MNPHTNMCLTDPGGNTGPGSTSRPAPARRRRSGRWLPTDKGSKRRAANIALHQPAVADGLGSTRSICQAVLY